MSVAIVGLAGHVDHGKTTLVHALTGIDPTRHPEEREREITIDIGFAHLALPDGRTLAFVDVPGHERFVHNMLAGETGADALLLVVAADEGVMPQTREHVGIVERLGITRGVVALTKIDAVDSDLAELATLELSEYLATTALAGMPIVPVSARTGSGLAALRDAIIASLPAHRNRPADGPVYLPIDRVFTKPGHGTVVTGSLWSGTLEPGQILELLPSRASVRVRRVEVHRSTQERATAGSRTAVNLAHGPDISPARGDVLSTPGEVELHRVVQTVLHTLRELPHSIRKGTQVRLHHGTSAIRGRVRLLDAPSTGPGEAHPAEIVLSRAHPFRLDDRFVLRNGTSEFTIGGGRVLGLANAIAKSRAGLADELRRREGIDSDGATTATDTAPQPGLGPGSGLVYRIVTADRAIEAEHLRRLLGLGARAFLTLMDARSLRGELVRDGGYVLSAAARAEVVAALRAALAAFHRAQPLEIGIAREDLISEIAAGAAHRELRLASGPVGAVLDTLLGGGELSLRDGRVASPSHRGTLSDVDREVTRRILAALASSPFAPPTQADVAKAAALPGARPAADLMRHLARTGELLAVSPDYAFHPDALRAARAHFESEKARRDGLTVAEFRDLVGATRKTVMPLLEYMDLQGVTLRAGDKRFLRAT